MSSRPHDVPTVGELVESVREWLDSVVTGDATPNPFHARVASNVLAMVERELAIGPELDRRHGERLAVLDVADDRELAAGIRAGRFDGQLEEVRQVVWASVRDKLAVANPTYEARRTVP